MTYTTRTRNHAVELYRNLQSSSKVAKILGCSASTVINYVRTLDPNLVRPPGPAQRVFTRHEKKKIVRLYRSGRTLSQIAHKMNCSVAGVHGVLDREGVARRPVGVSHHNYLREEMYMDMAHTYDTSPLTYAQVAENYGMEKPHHAKYAIMRGRELKKNIKGGTHGSRNIEGRIARDRVGSARSNQKQHAAD